MAPLRTVAGLVTMVLWTAPPAAGQSLVPFWSRVGIDLPHPLIDFPISFDDGTGSRLYGVYYSHLYEPRANVPARWDGASWELLTAGLPDIAANTSVWLQLVRSSTTEQPLLMVFIQRNWLPERFCYNWQAATQSWGPCPSFIHPEVHGQYLWVQNGDSGYLYTACRPCPGFSNRDCVQKLVNGAWVTASDPISGLGDMFVGNRVTANEVWFQANSVLCVLDGMQVVLLPGSGTLARTVVQYDDGSGLATYVGGTQSLAEPLSTVRKWDVATQSWTTPGGGLSAPVGQITQVNTMAVYDDGLGPTLYAAGWIGSAPGAPVLRGIAKFNGQDWQPVGQGVSGVARYMAVHDDGRGDSLYVLGGGMDAYGTPVARNILQWVGTREQCRPDCDNNHSVNVADFTCFLRKFASMDPYTDGNVDGVLEIGEFLRFMEQFAAGCH